MTVDKYNIFVDISKSDSANIAGPKPLTDAIYVGGAGIVVVVAQDDSTHAFTCIAGQVLQVAAKRVNSTTTSATLMIALYQM